MQNFSDSILSSGKRTEWDAADGRNTDGKWKVYSYWINSSCEAKALFRERQGVDALSRGREDRVAKPREEAAATRARPDPSAYCRSSGNAPRSAVPAAFSTRDADDSSIARHAAADALVVQDRMASPLMWTVHAPQSPAPHPNLVPLRFSSSRRSQRSGMSGSPSNW